MPKKTVNHAQILNADSTSRRILQLFTSQWTGIVIEAISLHDGICRTNTLQRSIPDITKRTLTQTLREMERDGLLTRKVYPVVPPKVEYSLTSAGELLLEPLELLRAWSEKHAEELALLTERQKNSVLEESNDTPDTTPWPFHSTAN